MESEILGKMNDRIVQGFLDLVILLEMRNRPLDSFDVINFAQRRFNISLTSSAVHSHLNSLEKDGLVKAETASGKKIYTLTDRGKETVSVLPCIRDKILGLFLNLFI
jgi:DNA-binding PadR family transcriptional regulator